MGGYAPYAYGMYGGSEVGCGELTMQSACRFVVGSRGILWRVVGAKTDLLPFVADFREPRAIQFRAIRNATKPRSPTFLAGTVGAVLLVGGMTDVRPAIVQAVSVPVVNLYVRRRVQNKSMQEGRARSGVASSVASFFFSQKQTP